MVSVVRRTGREVLLAVTLGLALLVIGPGQRARWRWASRRPTSRLPSTTGGDISLSDFRGKKWVLLEFYGADFAPT